MIAKGAWESCDLVGDAPSLCLPTPGPDSPFFTCSPDDRHRVKLHPLLGDPNSDYINANYIDVSGDGAYLRGGSGLEQERPVGPVDCQGLPSSAWRSLAQDGLICESLRHAMKSLPDLFMLISNFCLLCLSLLCSALSFFSLFPFLLPFSILSSPLACSHCHGSPSSLGRGCRG